MMRMANIIRDKAYYLQKCEFNEARANVVKRRLAGVVKVVVAAAATTVAAIIAYSYILLF